MKKLWGSLSIEVKIGIVIIAGFFFYIYGKKIWNALTRPEHSSDLINVNTANLTYPIADYSIMAEHIQSAMLDLGTDEVAITTTIDQCRTADDLRQLIVSFGERDYYSFGIVSFTGGLVEWLVYEMSVDELAPIKEKFNQLGLAF